VHNTYFTFPVLFIMLSNHFPEVYNHVFSAQVLIVLAVCGALVRHAMVTKNSFERWTILPAAIGVMSLIFLTAERGSRQELGPISFSEIKPVIAARCQRCHSTHPTDEIFRVPPKDVVFETNEQWIANADKIYLQVVVSKAMPLGNKTQITEAERVLIYRSISPYLKR